MKTMTKVLVSGSALPYLELRAVDSRLSSALYDLGYTPKPFEKDRTDQNMQFWQAPPDATDLTMNELRDFLSRGFRLDTFKRKSPIDGSMKTEKYLLRHKDRLDSGAPSDFGLRLRIMETQQLLYRIDRPIEGVRYALPDRKLIKQLREMGFRNNPSKARASALWVREHSRPELEDGLHDALKRCGWSQPGTRSSAWTKDLQRLVYGVPVVPVVNARINGVSVVLKLGRASKYD